MKILIVDKELEQIELSYISDEIIKWCNHFGNEFVGFCNVKYTLIRWFGSSTPTYLTKRSENICL